MKQPDKSKGEEINRRQFLKSTAVASAGAAVLVALPGEGVADDRTAGGETKADQGYRLTPHILAYYKSAAS